MKLQGRENASWGYRDPSEGWHSCVIKEGINEKVNETSGKSSLFVPLAIQEGSEQDGIPIAIFVNTFDENKQPYKFAEQQIADIVFNAGMGDALDKQFPGDVSYLNSRVIDFIKIKLPGSVVDVEVKKVKGKDGDRFVVNGIAKYASKFGKTAPKSTPKKEESSNLGNW